MSKKVLYPGEILKARLDELGIGQIILSIDTGLTPKTINSIIKGKVGISAETAALLEQYLPPITAEQWLELDYRWRLSKVERVALTRSYKKK